MAAPKRILIVDDEEDITWGISRSLAKAGYNFDVRCLNCGDAALAELRSSPFDLLVCDFRLPGRDGMQLILETRRDRPATKMIVMTAYGSAELREQVEDGGGFFYIEKPFEMGYLRQIMLEALELKDRGFKGVIESAGIRELVEYNCLRKRDSSLQLSKSSEEGTIYFRDGDIVHAECGELQGERAFYNILNWTKGTFKISSNAMKINRTIARDWKTLLHQCI